MLFLKTAVMMLGAMGPWLASAQPPNDDCVNADLVQPRLDTDPIAISSTMKASTFAFSSSYSCSGTEAPTLWYRVVGNGARFRVSTCASETNYNSVININDDSCDTVSRRCEAFDKNGDFGCDSQGLAATVEWFTKKGQVYRIGVTGLEPTDAGTFGLSVLEYLLPKNDECEDAILIQPRNDGQPSALGSTLNATSFQFSQSYRCSGTNSPTVWYKVLGTGARFRATTCSCKTDFNSVLNVNEALCGSVSRNCNDFSLYDSDCDFTGLGATVEWDTEPNTIYKIGVSGVEPTDMGSFALSVQDLSLDPTSQVNPCDGKGPDLPNIPCVIDEIYMTGEQSPVNVTKGYNGKRDTDAVPLTVPFSQADMCPVNVHWNLGAEHYSAGEYDEQGTGPFHFHDCRPGYQCSHYDPEDTRFTTPYDWQHCTGMVVGETYEVQWPHSAGGKCNTPWQYQTPFYDGMFCVDNMITDTAQQIGVQSQVFTIINDETYFYPSLLKGMIVDGDMGSDLAIYTGSTTSGALSNEICSPFTPITWQVDRKCHLISASSFDKMCQDMKAQADDMSSDLYAHCPRELVADEHAANNHQKSKMRLLRGGSSDGLRLV